jgi:hypothetical protein
VSATGPALLAAAAGVGFGHAILPDHWVPLAVVGRTRRYPLSRIARLSGLAGIAHVLVSIVLGAVIIAVGLQFRSTVEHAQGTIIGCILIATGIGFLVLEVTGHGHHHDHDHDHAHDGHDRDDRRPDARRRTRRLSDPGRMARALGERIHRCRAGDDRAAGTARDHLAGALTRSRGVG